MKYVHFKFNIINQNMQKPLYDSQKKRNISTLFLTANRNQFSIIPTHKAATISWHVQKGLWVILQPVSYKSGQETNPQL